MNYQAPGAPSGIPEPEKKPRWTPVRIAIIAAIVWVVGSWLVLGNLHFAMKALLGE